MTTNGTLVDKEKAKRLVEGGLRGVNVSIDSPLRKCMKRYEVWKARSKPPPRLSGFSIVTDEVAFPFGKTESEIRMGRAGRYAFGYYDQHPCFAPWTHSLIHFNGNVFVCCMTRERIPLIGNIRSQSFREIWEGAVYQRIRLKMHPPALKPCRRCDDFIAENKRIVDDTLVDWFELLLAEHEQQPFDVLHAYFLTQAGFVATYTGKYLHLPSVVSIHGNDIERGPFDPGRFSHVMYTMQNANAVTTNARSLMEKTKAFLDRGIFLIPNGIDTNLFKPMERNEALAETLGLKQEERVIAFVGELRQKKIWQRFLMLMRR